MASTPSRVASALESLGVSVGELEREQAAWLRRRADALRAEVLGRTEARAASS
jgi:hypothetical protein